MRASPSKLYEPFDGGRRRSFLLWGEHCTECAAPDCFSSCDLYDERPDRRCRRFEFGVFKNGTFPSAQGYGAEVVFKRWAKLEARGNATMLRAGLVKSLERAAGLLLPAINYAGSVADRLLQDIRWSYAGHSILERLNARLHRRRDPRHTPDAFVVELYNPDHSEVVLLLSMAVDRASLPCSLRADQLPRPLQKRLDVPPGYFREDIPRQAFRNIVESGLPFGIALMPEGAEGARLVFLSLDFVTFKETAGEARRGPSVNPPVQAKCVVFDLDNTLWDGILLEGEVRLREHVLGVVRQLDERGILISVASKNAPEDALEKLRALGLEDYLIFPAIGWGSKSESVLRIAKQLDIGTDTLIFVDDNPFERDEVARAVSGVEVLPDSAMHSLPDHPRLQGNVTEESRNRRLMYRQSMAREAASASLGGDYIEFLRSCDIRVEVRPDRASDAERIAELVQRTNQLNFSGRKYGRAELQQILADDGFERYVISCSDRYGSYGLVGFCLAEKTEEGVRIEDFMLSCRVQAKYVEQALLHHLCARPGWHASFVEINFKSTERNGAARAVLDTLGFPPSGNGPLCRELSPGDLAADFITVTGSYPPHWDDRASAEPQSGDVVQSRLQVKRRNGRTIF